MSEESRRPPRNHKTPSRYATDGTLGAAAGSGRSILPGFHVSAEVEPTSSRSAVGGRASSTVERAPLSGRVPGLLEGVVSPATAACRQPLQLLGQAAVQRRNVNDGIDVDAECQLTAAIDVDEDKDSIDEFDMAPEVGDATATARGSKPSSPVEEAPAEKAANSGQKKPPGRPKKDRRSVAERMAGKKYSQWSAGVLQSTCLKRGIAGMSKEKDKERMASLLAHKDREAGRVSPFLGDLGEDRDDGTASAPGTTRRVFPEKLVLAIRNAIKMGFAVEEGKTVDSEGVTYLVSDVVAHINEAEDAAAAAQAAEDSGDGADDGSKSHPTGRAKKTKHCIPRLTELLIHIDFLERFRVHKAQATRKQLDEKDVGKNKTFWKDVLAAYLDKDFKVGSSLKDNVHLADLDPTIIGQPHISLEKFMAMYTDIVRKWNAANGNYKTLSGNNADFRSFCRGNRDVEYFGEIAALYPEIVQICDNLMPEDVRREECGTRDASGAAGGSGTAAERAARRDDAKRRSREVNGPIGSAAGSGAKRKVARAKEIAEITNACVGSAMGQFATVMGVINPPESAAVPSAPIDDTRTPAGRRATAGLVNDMFEEYKSKAEELEAEEAKGDQARPVVMKFLAARVQKLEEFLAAEGEADL